MIEIYVNDLEKAAKQAGKAATQCTDYAKTLEKKVLHGINNYSGGNTANMSAAQRSINAKRSALTKKAQSFTDYQRKLTNFKDKVVNTENRLCGKITSLYGRFEKEYGISSEESTGEKFFGFFWGDDGKEWFRNAKNKIQSVREQVRNWYKYKGGKELLLVGIGIIAAVVSAVVAIAGIFSGGIIIGIIAAIAAVITTATTLIQMSYYASAGEYAAQGVTHMAGRLLKHGEKENLVTTLKRFGMYDIAKTVGIVEFACNAILFFRDAGKVFKNWKAAGGLKGLWKGFLERKDMVLSGKFKNLLSTIYKFSDNSLLGQLKRADDFLKIGKGIIEGKPQDIIDGVIKWIGSPVIAPIYKDSSGTIKQYEAISKIASTAKKGIKAIDGITSALNFKTVFNFTYDKNAGKDASKFSIGDFKLENFGSLGKLTVYSVEKISDVLSGIKGIMDGIKMPDMRTIVA